MNSNIFNINFERLVIWNVATFLRKTVRIKWFGVMISPVTKLYDSFKLFRDAQLYKMSHNSQIVYLQKVLNDQFDNTNRGIYIQNTDILEPPWYYDTADNKPLYFYDEADRSPVYHYDNNDYYENNVDFTVYIPTGLKPATPDAVTEFERQINYFVNYYKLYSKEFNLKYY